MLGIARVWVFPVLLMNSMLMAQDLSPRRIIRNVENKLASSETVRVEFEESYAWKLTGEEQSIRGVLILEGRDRFRVVTEDQLIVSDGETLWTYSKPSHRVLIDNLSTTENTLLPRQILFQYTEEYQARIIGEEMFMEKPCYVLGFTPETGDVFFTEIKAWVDKKEFIPLKVLQIDLNENETVYVLHDVEIGVELEKGTFTFTIPEDAEVIDMR